MRLTLALVAGFILGIGVAMAPRFLAHIHQVLLSSKLRPDGRAEQRVHTEETFEFTVSAPPEKVAPLFGADAERRWASGWNPQFIWPSVAEDRQGMVFTVSHGNRNAIWVSTFFEPRTGHCQYVYVLPDTMVTVIALQWNPQGSTTHITVKYDRTALSAHANPIVEGMAEQDAKSGPEWQEQLAKYLKPAASSEF